LQTRLRGPQIDTATSEQLLERLAFRGCVGMQRETHPPDPDVEISLQLFNTPGTEIAPGSDKIGKDLQCDWFAHSQRQ
jgi:hypothetical protein